MPVQATVATTIANTRSSSSGRVPRSIESVISDRSNTWTAPIDQDAGEHHQAEQRQPQHQP